MNSTPSPLALITGASSGIGKELALLFAQHRIPVILVARSEHALAALRHEIQSTYSIPVHIQVQDLSKENAAEELYHYCIQNQFQITHLVNNAGFGDVGFFHESDARKNKEMMELNMVALTELCRFFIPDMIAQAEGRVLNVASTAAFQPGPLMAVYFASKAYVLHFSEALNDELKGTGVSVTTLCPGATQTQFAKVAGFNDDGLFDKKKKFPSAQEVAKLGFESMTKRKPVVIHGLKNKLLAWSVRFAPRQWVVKITRITVEK
jgi:short-subunit dehydrogenase